ncbi:hypothetical protein LCGC14_1032570 [marine sediment metagenome]|uniref:Uncharacterized protein n=1 Tax=marine sediment metagenome TaxID=412755 RepID=A0A0F9R074_9ZZZZ|nr:MAG: hypothetical protein Lokiarch_01440 [Candidatus Lokiarchaeum sp. GC14_75]
MLFSQKKKVYFSIILLCIGIGILLLTILYYFSWSFVIESYIEIDGALGVVVVILSRIIIVSGMTFFIFLQWFKQEDQYFSDLPFLFGLFFLLLVFGKAFDLLIDFIFYQVDEIVVMLLTKIRFIIMILDFLPMIYLSIGMILFSFSLKEKFKSLSNEKYLNKVRIRVILLIIVSEIAAIIFINNIQIISYLYPIIVIPSLITIVWLFNFAFRNKRLSNVNTSILWKAFSAYLISQIIRPLAQVLIGESPLFLIFAETLDLVIFIVIFIGFYKKANYVVK